MTTILKVGYDCGVSALHEATRCGASERVCSDLREEYEDLVAQNFDVIIAMKDARGETSGTPITLADVPKLRRWLNRRMPTAPIRPIMILVVMETEAWFIAEHTHLSRINPRLGLNDVTSVLGFDPSVNRHLVESIPGPAESLDLIYQRAGERYQKSELIKRTMDSLDIAEIYGELGWNIPPLAQRTIAIRDFLT